MSTPDAGAVPVPGTIAACLVARNEADKLPPALASVAWVDEIVVLDLESEDGSGEVAREHGAQVHRRPPHPVVEPLRDEVAGHCRSEWVLVLDPDERVRPGLARALREAAKRDDIDAVVVPRMNIDFGWPPSSPLQRYEQQLRMYRRSAVRWPHFPNKLPDVADDRLLRLPRDDEHVLEHDRNRSVAEAADRLVRYAPAQAVAMAEAGQEFTAAGMLAVLRTQFERHVLAARAWEDGVPGLVRAGILVNHHFYVWVALWAQTGARRTADDDDVARRVGAGLQVLGLALRVGRVAGRTTRRVRRRAA